MEKHDPMYCDSGVFMSQIKRKNTREYAIWNGIRGRCYRDYGAKDLSYKGCSVAPEFYSFQKFAAWVNNQIGFNEGFQLDKDLLFKGNKLYAPDTCVFLPLELNSLLIKNTRNRGNYPIGVSLDKNMQEPAYIAAVRRSQRQYKLGSYKTPEEAFSVYKAAKQEILRDAAEQYKEVIDHRAYLALMNYQVEITD